MLTLLMMVGLSEIINGFCVLFHGCHTNKNSAKILKVVSKESLISKQHKKSKFLNNFKPTEHLRKCSKEKSAHRYFTKMIL